MQIGSSLPPFLPAPSASSARPLPPEVSPDIAQADQAPRRRRRNSRPTHQPPDAKRLIVIALQQVLTNRTQPSGAAPAATGNHRAGAA